VDLTDILSFGLKKRDSDNMAFVLSAISLPSAMGLPIFLTFLFTLGFICVPLMFIKLLALLILHVYRYGEEGGKPFVTYYFTGI
jgi:hypothetical protein